MWFAPLAATAILSVPTGSATLGAEEREIPDSLKPWAAWALWDAKDVDSPTPYLDPKQALHLWPSKLALEVDNAGGHFTFGVTVFGGTWVPLPGGGDQWPNEVTANGAVVPVVEHEGRPAVKLVGGHYDLTGAFRWQGVPLRITMPAEIGILSLMLNGQAVPSPVWDAQGFLWLKRDAATEQTDKDFLGVKMNSLLEDGIPLWLHTEIELIVAGKSREETLGVVLPEGWKLSAITSPIPVAVDNGGKMKAQVRAGKWTVDLTAFRLDHPSQFGYAAGSEPAAAEQLVAFHAQPDFRLVEISGWVAIDVSQTPFPDKWRENPVYRWDTSQPFRMDERMRGMGLQKPQGLHIDRELWLDENGGGLTFRDRITGHLQQVWRLDAAAGQDLGSVRENGEGQLITRNPKNGAHGVEIRDRELNLDATGRMACGGEPTLAGRSTPAGGNFDSWLPRIFRPTLPATGWRTDADGLNVTLNLPPGWRLFALFGADSVSGDWLTAWTLLDLFLLLIFTLAVLRMWGFWAALLALLAFGLSYHEPGAPRYAWLALLMPLALLRVVPDGWGQRLLGAVKWLAVLWLILVLVPFLGKQIQQCLYPQLEDVRDACQGEYRTDYTNAKVGVAGPVAEGRDPFSSADLLPGSSVTGWKNSRFQANENLSYDTKARIQTGPGVPEWRWRAVHFSCNGPVTAGQVVKPILIPLPVERGVSLARVVLLIGLAAVLLNARRVRRAVFRKGNVRRSRGLFRNGGKVAPMVVALCFSAIPRAGAQLPNKEMLDTLRARLTEKSDAYPTAADIPQVALTLWDRKLAVEVEIHTATRTAVPLPGRLPGWSPVTVKVDGQPEATLRRDDGYLWVVLPAGVHRVSVEGVLADLTEWQWTYQLRPRRVTIDAPGWQINGVKPGGVPEAQVFFSRVRQTTAGEASYDHPNLQNAVGVERQLELGLVWQVRTKVSRYSPVGNAVSLRVPLLPGENVITSNAVMKDGFIEVRLGAQQKEFTWQSELSVVPSLKLATRTADTWVEHWSLVASPVWNVAISGLPPTFEAGDAGLVPVWKPWPGEAVELQISRPEAIAGATVTVERGTHQITLGKRQRSSTLTLDLRCSLGEDFLIALPADAETTSLTSNNAAIPIRKDGNKIIVPLKPGEQKIELQWKSDQPLDFLAQAEPVRLAVESANITTTLQGSDDRWVLWTQGPLRGPAVRFWGILLGSLLIAWVLGRMTQSPLRSIEWMLLAIGLTQIPLPLALVIVGWLFFLVWRGSGSFLRLPPWTHNLLQLFLIFLTLCALGIFVAIVREGLLGSPEMFIRGNDSSRTLLRWYEARCDGVLPQPLCYSISIWWYRLMMLLWALWLAAALIRWLHRGWQQFSSGGCFRGNPPPATQDMLSPPPPPLPPTFPEFAPGPTPPFLTPAPPPVAASLTPETVPPVTPPPAPTSSPQPPWSTLPPLP